MNIPYTELKKLNKEINQLFKFAEAGDMDLSYGYDAQYQPVYTANYHKLRFSSLEDLYGFSKFKQIPLNSTMLTDSPFWWSELCKIRNEPERTLSDIQHNTAKLFKTLKLVPESIGTGYRPKVIKNAPAETTQGDFTYRIITDYDNRHMNHVILMARNDEPIYDYLDAGFYFKAIEQKDKKGEITTHYVVANEYDVNTAHIFMMCIMQPSLVEMLRDGCFINVYEAELLRLKMHKKMDTDTKSAYNTLSKHIDDDYKKNTTLLVVSKLMNDEIEKTTINNVVLTKTSATYAQVSLEAEDLLDVLFKSLNFNLEFDIYTIVDVYAKHVERLLVKENAPEALVAVVNLDEPNAQPEAEEVDTAVLKELPTFSVNGISITPAVSDTYQRYLNKVRINREEISKAIHRASCYHDAEDYKLFLKSVCRMSIKWHDVIANGLPVKIHSSITNREYNDETAGPDAPALQFSIDKAEKCIKIHIDKERKVKVSLAKLVKRIETLNKKTDNGWMRRRDWTCPFGYRSYEWSQYELTKLLVEASTFTVKGVDAEGKPTETKQVLLTKEDIVKLLSAANEAKKAAVEKSKEFLATAVKLTKAEQIEFMGEKAYKVHGSLRTYAVIIKTAKVYDFETKQYRCIVNDRHYAGAGYDDIAARLLALKNDGVMQQNITTLASATGQPGAENAHNYHPERENTAEGVAALVDNALTTV